MHIKFTTIAGAFPAHRRAVLAVLSAVFVLCVPFTLDSLTTGLLVRSSAGRSSIQDRVWLRRQDRLRMRIQQAQRQTFLGQTFTPEGSFLHRVAPILMTLGVDAVATPFPAFDHAVFPVSRVPDWGAMRTAFEWSRQYDRLAPSDFVAIPRYDLALLTEPMDGLIHPLRTSSIPIITAKLFYSTRYFGAYDLDAGEFTGTHAGIDLKLAEGTPVGAVAGGRVETVAQDGLLGLHVIIEHHVRGERIFSIYGHLGGTIVREGQDVAPGDGIGTVGMTGSTSAPHLHLQIDRDRGEVIHTPYTTSVIPSREEAARWTYNPVTFIQEHAAGE
jgi:murein DD-endopeptidase MepM/ murein hydrolase activator NlpD